MANLGIPELGITQTWEPKQPFRFTLFVDGLPTFLIYKCNRPQLTSQVVTIDHINVKRYVKGKSQWQPINITLYDAINPSSAMATMQWVRLGHESVTGRDGYAAFYKKDIQIRVYGPTGDQVQLWQLKGAWIVDNNPGQLDWTNNGQYMSIDLQIRYDYAILQY